MSNELAARCRAAVDAVFRQSSDDYKAEVARINSLEGWTGTPLAFDSAVRPKLFTGDPANKEPGEYALIISINHRFEPAPDEKRRAEYAALSSTAEGAYETAAGYFRGDYYYPRFFDRVANLLGGAWHGEGAALLNQRALCVEMHPYWSERSSSSAKKSQWNARAQVEAEQLLRWVLDEFPPAIVVSVGNSAARMAALAPWGFRLDREGYLGGTTWMHRLAVGSVGGVPAAAVAFDYSPAEYRKAAAGVVGRLVAGDSGQSALAAAGLATKALVAMGALRVQGSECPYTARSQRERADRYISKKCGLSLGWQDSSFFDLEEAGAATERHFHVVYEFKATSSEGLVQRLDQIRGGGPGTCPVEGAPPLRLMRWPRSKGMLRLGFAWQGTRHPSVELVTECWDWLRVNALNRI